MVSSMLFAKASANKALVDLDVARKMLPLVRLPGHRSTDYGRAPAVAAVPLARRQCCIWRYDGFLSCTIFARLPAQHMISISR